MASLVKSLSSIPVRVHFDDGLEVEAAALLDLLARQHADGLVLAPGLRLRVGWTFLVLQETDGELVVCEPDYTGNPFQQLRSDVSTFLRVTASHQWLAAMLGVTPTEASFQDKIIYAAGVFDAKRLYAERLPPNAEKNDSGWFYGYRDDDGDNSPQNLRAAGLYELLLRKPILMQTTVLPAGCLVILEDDRIQDIVGADNQSLPRR